MTARAGVPHGARTAHRATTAGCQALSERERRDCLVAVPEPGQLITRL
jgi:hypothetical protein